MELLLHGIEGNIKCASISRLCQLFLFEISRDGKENLANIIGLFENFVMVSPLALSLIAGN